MIWERKKAEMTINWLNSKPLSNIGVNFAASTPACSAIHGVEEGETCSSIIQRFNLVEGHFLEINPNINCVGIFVGQWVCVEGQVAWVLPIEIE